MKVKAECFTQAEAPPLVRVSFDLGPAGVSVARWGALSYDDPAEALQDAARFVEAALEAVKAQAKATR